MLQKCLLYLVKQLTLLDMNIYNTPDPDPVEFEEPKDPILHPTHPPRG